MTTPPTHLLLPAATRTWRPWKNGGGVMADIAVSPSTADWDTFKWRVGIAKIEKDGPFSTFPGVDRSFMIVGGKGVKLTVAGIEPARITHKSPPFAFPGESAATAQLTDGPTEALNIMVRRGGAQTRLALVDEPSEFVPGSEAFALLVWARGRADLLIHGEPVSLGLHDAVLFEPGVNVKVRPGDHSHGWLIEARNIELAPPGAANS